MFNSYHMLGTIMLVFEYVKKCLPASFFSIAVLIMISTVYSINTNERLRNDNNNNHNTIFMSKHYIQNTQCYKSENKHYSYYCTFNNYWWVLLWFYQFRVWFIVHFFQNEQCSVFRAPAIIINENLLLLYIMHYYM